MEVFAFLTVFLGLIGAFPASAQTREQEAQALIDAYPDHLAGFDGANLIWKDGTRMPFGEGRAGKPLQELMDRPDIADMFYWPYVFDGGAPPQPWSATQAASGTRLSSRRYTAIAKSARQGDAQV